MANQKISTLPAAASAINTDQHEVNQGGVSKRLTTQQVVDLIAGNPGGTPLNNIGDALLFVRVLEWGAGGGSGLGNDGSIRINGGVLLLQADGSVLVNTPNLALNSNGSANFAAGGGLGVTITMDGDVEVLDQNRGLILHSRPGNIRFRLVVNNAGIVSTEAA